jgi:outer membrane lipoprotein-sorting protein
MGHETHSENKGWTVRRLTQALRLIPAMAAIAVTGLLGQAATARIGGAPGYETRHVSANIQEYVSADIRDLTATLTTGSYDRRAGAKISKAFGMLYKITGNGVLYYKQPNDIRIDGRVAGMHATYIMDGSVQHIHVGWIKNNRDESGNPGNIRTLLDEGLLNPYCLTYENAFYQGEQDIQGTRCAVFQLNFAPQLHNTSFRRIWIDPRTRITLRREEHDRDGKLHEVYAYRNPVQAAPGIWIPTVITAYNAAGEKVGDTIVSGIGVNRGIGDKLFQ